MYVMQCFGVEVTEREQGSGWLAGRAWAMQVGNAAVGGAAPR